VNETQNKLPADPGAMVLGIIALVISLIGCCCGILAIPALVMSIIGLVWANKSLKAYAAQPDHYTARSYSSTKSAKVVNIIALILSAIFVLVSLIWFGNFMADPGEIFEQLENGEWKFETTETYGDDEVLEESDSDIDTWEYEEDDAIIEDDSLELEERVIEVEDFDGVNDSI
jgi:hypothetical protein